MQSDTEKKTSRDDHQAAFDQSFTYQIGSIRFQVYKSIASIKENQMEEKNTKPPPILLCVHGAGLSSHSWVFFIRACKKLFPAGSEFITYDLYDHGLTVDSKGNNGIENYSLDHLTNHLRHIIELLYPSELLIPSLQRMILIGHSLGGAIITNLTAKKSLPSPPFAIVNLEIVEETAIKSLARMDDYIHHRPTHFSSPSEAIQWSIQSTLLANEASSRISIPYLLEYKNNQWGWRTDLSLSKPYWQGWFSGFSKQFLTAPTTKLLILRDSHILDNELLVGQMQGKYQLSIVPAVTGHVIHEDLPNEISMIVFNFWKRFYMPFIPLKKLG